MSSQTKPLALVLYTGPHCELCDHAMEVYRELSPVNTSLESLNIREDTELYHLYAVRIPVIKRMDTQAELCWPFDVKMLEQFLQ